MIEENSWYSQISLAYIHFLYFLFGNNFKCRDARARKVPRTPISPLPRFASYSTFAPPAVSFAFFHVHFFSYTCAHTLPYSYLTPTCSHLRHNSYSATHTQFVLCWVSVGCSVWKQQGSIRGWEVRDEEKGGGGRGALATWWRFHSLAPFSLLPMQTASTQVFWFRADLLHGQGPEKVLVT